MSDIEIIETNHGIGRKRKSGLPKENDHKKKKNRKTSELMEKNGELKGTETVFKDFVIDRTETTNKKMNNKDVDVLQIEEAETTSSWQKMQNRSLLGEEEPEKTPKKKPFRSKKNCYNCSGDHNLSDCALPKNYSKISEAKRIAGNEIRDRQQKYQRITDQYSKDKGFKPGVLSNNLRRALGIRGHQIPEYIYRMRRMGFVKGYPPGYLRKAIKKNGILKIISSDDSFCGEQDGKDEGRPDLDPTKMVSYPGFNSNDDRLEDLEEFKIPQMEVFCQKYQEELNFLFEAERKRNKKLKNQEEKRKSQKIIFDISDDEADDVVIVGESSSSVKTEECLTPGEESNVKVLISEDMKTPAKKKRNEDSIKEGDSLFHYVGTPVFSSRTPEGVWAHTALPSLEAFSVGIIPFAPKEEETEKKGIYKLLMSQLKRSKSESVVKKEESKEEEDEVIIVENVDTSEDGAKKKKKKKNKKKKENCHIKKEEQEEA